MIAIKSDVVESEKRTKNDSTASESRVLEAIKKLDNDSTTKESRVLEAIKNLNKDLNEKLDKLDNKVDNKLEKVDKDLNETLDKKLGRLTKIMWIGFISVSVAIVGCKVPNEGWKAFWVFVGIGSKLAG